MESSREAARTHDLGNEPSAGPACDDLAVLHHKLPTEESHDRESQEILHYRVLANPVAHGEVNVRIEESGEDDLAVEVDLPLPPLERRVRAERDDLLAIDCDAAAKQSARRDHESVLQHEVVRHRVYSPFAGSLAPRGDGGEAPTKDSLRCSARTSSRARGQRVRTGDHGPGKSYARSSPGLGDVCWNVTHALARVAVEAGAQSSNQDIEVRIHEDRPVIAGNVTNLQMFDEVPPTNRWILLGSRTSRAAPEKDHAPGVWLGPIGPNREQRYLIGFAQPVVDGPSGCTP